MKYSHDNITKVYSIEADENSFHFKSSDISLVTCMYITPNRYYKIYLKGNNSITFMIKERDLEFEKHILSTIT